MQNYACQSVIVLNRILDHRKHYTLLNCNFFVICIGFILCQFDCIFILNSSYLWALFVFRLGSCGTVHRISDPRNGIWLRLKNNWGSSSWDDSWDSSWDMTCEILETWGKSVFQILYCNSSLTQYIHSTHSIPMNFILGTHMIVGWIEGLFDCVV